MSRAERRIWHNYVGTQSVEPLRWCIPTTVQDIVALVHEAARLRCPIRAVGSGHSWSDIALAPGILIDTSRLNRILDPEVELRRLRVDSRSLVRMEAGISLRELNAHLDAHGLALSNMGGYDGQTVAGVISTSTHGSGITYGPLAEQVRSVDLVGGDGTVYRIEPAGGITDVDAFAARYPDRVLRQSDDWFDAAVVGLGSLGIVHAVILEVEPKYWLKEVRCMSTWSEVKKDLQTGDPLRRNLHYEVLFNPHRTGSDHSCLVTTRNRVQEPVHLPKDKSARHPLVEIAAQLPIVAKLLLFLFNWKPGISPQMIDRALEALVDPDYTNVSYKVLNIGTANDLPVFSMEIAVPMVGDVPVRAVETVMAVAEERRMAGEVYHTAPISLRFVKQFPAYMSMMYGAPTMMIEIMLLVGTRGGNELLGAHAEALHPLQGRPHWGHVNHLTASAGQLRAMYPRYDDWMRIRHALDPQDMFSSPFTQRVGITEYAFRV